MKKHLWAICFIIILTSYTLFISLDTFVITRVYQTGANKEKTDAFAGMDNLKIDIEKSHDGETYQNDNVYVKYREYYIYNTKIYLADVQVTSAKYIKTALAKNTYGRHIVEKTSKMAEDNNAILAINGDYYGARESGYVIRNGILYRDEGDGEDSACIWADGSMEIVNSKDVTAQELVDRGAWQVFSFGPALIKDSEIQVSKTQEVKRALAKNPRAAIGIIDKGHYLFFVSDGRSIDSFGMSLYQVAKVLQQFGVKTAYNLDGGGSATIYLNGEVVNKPNDDGNGNIKERKVSDIVYIGK